MAKNMGKSVSWQVGEVLRWHSGVLVLCTPRSFAGQAGKKTISATSWLMHRNVQDSEDPDRVRKLPFNSLEHPVALSLVFGRILLVQAFVLQVRAASLVHHAMNVLNSDIQERTLLDT
jgi:hypothetical protein